MILRIGLLAIVLAVLTATTGALAAPVLYLLDGEASRVGFAVDFGPDEITGRFPVSEARLELDLQNVARSTVAVTLDADGAVASFPFAAQALKGPTVLDTRTHPTIAFVSSSLARTDTGARVLGDLTIRGVTRPVELQARLFRRVGADPQDFSRLFIQLTGAVNRSAFGATGWSDAVGDEVRIDILAEIARADGP